MTIEDITRRTKASGIKAILTKKNVESEAKKKGRNMILIFSRDKSLREIKMRNRRALDVTLLILLSINYSLNFTNKNFSNRKIRERKQIPYKGFEFYG
ncbi:MAG: hypothetical protein JZD40_02095 [Sulfolobus sp.]|nr:hypothetical protein [Sulfolobus sp.]